MVLLSRNHFAETRKSGSKSDSVGRKTFPWAYFHVTQVKDFVHFHNLFLFWFIYRPKKYIYNLDRAKRKKIIRQRTSNVMKTLLAMHGQCTQK